MFNPNNFRVIRQNGEVFDMMENGIIVNKFVPDSPSPRHNRETIDGRDGYIDQGTSYDGKVIDSKITILAVDDYDYPLLRNQIFKMFDSREYFYIVPDEEPGKRYRVKYDSSFSLTRFSRFGGEFDITFSSDLAYAESLGSTLDPLTFDVEKWQVGQGLIAEELKYIHKTTSFKIFNAGDIAIDPREHDFEISIKGKSAMPDITNLTTGDKWESFFYTSEHETIVIDGVKTMVDGWKSMFTETNRQLITLAPGWNDIRISGMQGEFEVKFDFRFLYL